MCFSWCTVAWTGSRGTSFLKISFIKLKESFCFFPPVNKCQSVLNHKNILHINKATLWINSLRNIAPLSCSTKDSIREDPFPVLMVVIHDPFSTAGLNEGLESSKNKPPRNWKRPKDSIACYKPQ